MDKEEIKKGIKAKSTKHLVCEKIKASKKKIVEK